MMGYGWGDAGWLGMGIGMVLMVVLVVVVVWLVVRGLMALERRERGDGPADEAVEVVRRRFAAGEIDVEEYERRLAALKNPR